MLKLYVAESCCALIDALAEAVAPKARGLEGKNFIFTEEKTTLITERAILKRVGGTFNTRVFSMRRFLKSLYEPKDLLSKEGSVMLLRKIIGERAEELSCLKRARRKSLAPAVYECIAQLKSAKVGAEELRAAAARAEGLLKDKLSDIALLYEAYENAIDGRYKDQSNYLAALPALAERGVKSADVYVAAYSSFTRQEIEVVKSFMRCARSVTGYLVSGENEFAYTSEAAEAYRRAAREVGEELEIVSLGGEEGVQRRILQNIFNPSFFRSARGNESNLYVRSGFRRGRGGTYRLYHKARRDRRKNALQRRGGRPRRRFARGAQKGVRRIRNTVFSRRKAQPFRTRRRPFRAGLFHGVPPRLRVGGHARAREKPARVSDGFCGRL